MKYYIHIKKKLKTTELSASCALWRTWHGVETLIEKHACVISSSHARASFHNFFNTIFSPHTYTHSYNFFNPSGRFLRSVLYDPARFGQLTTDGQRPSAVSGRPPRCDQNKKTATIRATRRRSTRRRSRRRPTERRIGSRVARTRREGRARHDANMATPLCAMRSQKHYQSLITERRERTGREPQLADYVRGG